MKRVARIPAEYVHRYMGEHGLTFTQFIADQQHAKRLLADPALARFKVKKGRA